MRPSEPIPPSFVRPKLNQRNQVQPLWMRVLEEKYQKLQLKIAQSTATMNGLYNSTIGRSIYDTKLVRASLQNPPQITKRRNSKPTRISATKISNNPGAQRNPETNQGVDREINDRTPDGTDKVTKINHQHVRVSEILCLRYDKNQTRKKDLSEQIKAQAKKLSKSFVGDYSNNIQNTEMSSSRHSIISTHKTTRSCPVDNRNCAHGKSRIDSAGNTKINRRKMKMFSRMSAEAQTALTETILENNSEGNVDSEDEECHNKETIEDNVFEAECIYSYEDINKMNENNVINDSEISVASKDSRSIHTRLPEIQNDNQEYLTLRHMKPVDGRVPGIGKFPFPTKREATFEITPPGFDIRYKDAPIREERESETPPPDIRDRAIRKCEDWLSRYTPRTSRSSQTSS